MTDTANYTVIVYDQQCSATAEDSVTINFYNEATANQIEDLITCDDSSNDGVEDFDLNIVANDILGDQNSSEFVVTYFLSISDAQNILILFHHPTITLQTLKLFMPELNM